MQNTKSLEGQLYKAGVVSLVILSLFGYVYLRYLVPQYTLPCAFYSMLGIYCPGCGGTRATEALLHGHVLHSLWYHPLVLYTAVMFVGFMGTQTLARLHVGRIKGWKFHNWYLWVALGIIMVNWIMKNILLFGFGITL